MAFLSACQGKEEACPPEEDEDGDGYCGSEDCDDQDRTIHPGASDPYQDGVMQDCAEPDGTDEDGDGYPPGDVGETDCDDSNPDIFPGATERCDDLDDDCDDEIDEDDADDAATWYADTDGDGYGSSAYATAACEQPEGYVSNSDDCDDLNGDIHPEADDATLDGTDQDCDDQDGADQDGDGSIAGIDGAGDCDDADATVFPGATERCDDLDNDCDEVIDEDDAEDAATWYADSDGDGFGDPGESQQSCAAPEAYVGDSSDCDDALGEVNPGVEETTYNGIDDDCDAATIDDDLDLDGYALALDCDDDDPSRYPGADEVCGDGVVNDCDTTTGAAMEDCGLGGEVDLSASDAVFTGVYPYDLAGQALAGGGDVNGDGFDDLLISTDMSSSSENAGVAWLVLGPSSGTSSLEEADARMVGEESGDQAGTGQSGLGDVDGDGYDDLLVGAPYNDGDGADRGIIYLISGPVTGELDLASDASASWVGDVDDARAGLRVAGVGDTDGDDVDDLLIGQGGFSEGNFSGAWLLSGDAVFEEAPTLQDAVDGGIAVSLTGEHAHDSAGRAVSGGGDVDGDGLADVLIGAYSHADGSDLQVGAAYVVLGPVSTSLGLADADARLLGEDPADYAGGAVAGAGDIDGDGLDDLLVGAIGDDRGGTGAGAVYLVLGTISVTVDMEEDLADATARLVGASSSDQAGTSIDGVGDVDGDGTADVLVGAPGADDACLVLGPISATVNLEDADVIMVGSSISSTGYAVAGAGDPNADGFADLLIGAPYDDSIGVGDAGYAALILGGGY